MVDKQRIAEIDKAISDTRAELAAIRQEKAAAEADNDPERLVLAEKQERRKVEALAALERTMTAATYKPPVPTDRAELLQGFQKYRDEKAAKLAKVNAAIRAAEREQQDTANALHRATAHCDTEKAVELSEKRAELESRLKHLAEMRQRVEALPLYPAGAFAEEWAAICEKMLPDWKKQVLQVETLAAEYTAACAALLGMYDTLNAVRDDIGRMAAAEKMEMPFFAPVFTVGLNSEKLTVTKGDYIRLAGIESPIVGRAL